MFEQQVASEVVEALKLIVSGGIGGAVAASIGNWFVSKKLQTQKHEHDKQLESLKTKHGKKSTVHKLQFEKEFQLYGELWKAIIDVKSTVVITPTLDRKPNCKSFPEVYQERYDTAINAFNKANRLFNEHRPFYHESVSEQIKIIFKECRKHIWNVGQMLNSNKNVADLFDEADALFQKVPEAINEIEKTIKDRIGLLQEAEIVE